MGAQFRPKQAGSGTKMHLRENAVAQIKWTNGEEGWELHFYDSLALTQERGVVLRYLSLLNQL